jgi:hypothetical protein
MNWISSRMPSALHHGGPDVILLAPRDALVTKSRFARRVRAFRMTAPIRCGCRRLRRGSLEHPALSFRATTGRRRCCIG